MSLRLRYVFWTLLALPLAAFATLAVRDPDGFSRTFLRTGGRIVLSATNKPKLVAILLALAVAAVWGAIALACALERSRSNHSTDD